MKPNFALALSNDGVSLLQRAASGWLEVGATPFDVSDLDAALSGLRDAALALAPEGVSTKLIIPNSEIRYVTILAPGPTDEARLHQIAAQIDGLTPYALEELAFDWAVEGDHAHVAIVARETLAEAEDFARQHRFNPVSFVAQPQGADFPTEPFLGLTELSATILPDGARVQPDIEPVRVTGKASSSARGVQTNATAMASPKPTLEVAAPETKSAVPPVKPVAAPEVAAPVVAAPKPAAAAPQQAEPAKAAPDSGADAPASKEAGVSGLVRRMGTMLRRQNAVDAASKSDEPAKADTSKPVPEKADPKSPSVETPAVRTTVSETSDKAATPAFSTRRTAPVVVATTPVPNDAGPRLGGRLAILPEAEKKTRAPLIPASLLASLAFWKRDKPEAATKSAVATPDAIKPVAFSPKSAPAPTAAPAPKAAATPATTSDASTVTDEERKRREAESLTIFGARGASTGNENFARRGLLMTGGLLLVLVALGIWAVYFTATPPTQDDVTATPAPAVIEPRAEEPTTAAPVEVEPEITPDSDLAQVIDPEDLLPADEPVEFAIDQPLIEDTPAEVAAEDEIVTEAPAEDSALPATEDTAVEIVEAPEDAVAPESLGENLSQEAPQALAMPEQPEIPELAEVLPEPAAPPPPPGAEFEHGPDGLVIATPEGALTPSGTTVFSRRPGAVPPPRPASIAPPPAPEPQGALEVPEDAPQQQAQLSEEEPAPGEDPALAAFRPEPRSERVAAMTPPAAETETDVVEDGLAVSEADAAESSDAETAEFPTAGALALDALRPVARPETLAADPEPEEPSIDLTGATPQAVARSLRPGSRPDDLSDTIARVEAAQERARTAAAAAPAAVPETTPAAAGPQIPTSASVAQQATQARAINLREINLIGVFGTPNDRRALVRLPTGRVVRVQVGDRLDGGQVAAISDTELRYVKNGRNEVLRIGQRG